jgi:hypothetical protein
MASIRGTSLCRTAAWLALLALIAAGCQGIHARLKKPTASCHCVPISSCADPESAARASEATLRADADATTLLSLAEHCFLAGCQTADGLERVRDAAVYSAFALAAGGDASLESRAIAVHNAAVERLMRVSQCRCPTTQWPSTFHELGIDVCGNHPLEPERLRDIHIACDYEVEGFHCHFRNDGVGVPLVPLRPNDTKCPVVTMDRFYPGQDQHRPPATAVLQPAGNPVDWRSHRQRLALYDPYACGQVQFGERRYPLASDRTTPLAVQVRHSNVIRIGLEGVFRPEVLMEQAGIYMLQPYQPGKIPVVFVHGLAGHPSSFIQTINKLQNDCELSPHYQLWFYLYPTGEPMTSSAARLKRVLRDAIETLDPAGVDPALRNMVIVAHSQGGVVAKLLIQCSGDEMWNALFAVPLQELSAPPEVKEHLAEELFYQPEPYVGRMIFMAAPHGGTKLALKILPRLAELQIRKHEVLTQEVKEIVRENGRSVLAPGVLLRRINGVANMAPNNPMLAAARRTPLAEDVPYHNIMFLLPEKRRPTDGMVLLPNAVIEGAVTEVIVPGDHRSEDKPEAYAELVKLLRLHLDESGIAGSRR